MADVEKVIKGLEVCTSIEDGESCPKECPYYQDVCYGYDQLMRDALAMLKEQERKKGSWDYGTQCSVCKGTIVPPWKRDIRVNFCPWCGADMRDSYKSEGR